MSSTSKILEDLINENPNKEILFEQYKLYVEMANDISKRRDSTNKFYATLMSLLLTVFSIISSLTNELALFIIPLGIIILFSKVWKENINSYSTLNQCKFDVINELENQLPVKGFTIELELMKLYEYTKLTKVEKYVPSIICYFSIIAEIFLMVLLLIQKRILFL